LDDLGSHSSTPWAEEKLYQLINHRYNARLATVITTSLPNEQIEPRLRSRMTDGRLSMTWLIEAPDYRLNQERRPAQKSSILRRNRASR